MDQTTQRRHRFRLYRGSLGLRRRLYPDALPPIRRRPTARGTFGLRRSFIDRAMVCHSLAVNLRFTCNATLPRPVVFFGVTQGSSSGTSILLSGVGFFGLGTTNEVLGRSLPWMPGRSGIRESPPPVYCWSSNFFKSLPIAGMSFGSAFFPPPRWIGRLNVVKDSPAYSIIAYASMCNEVPAAPLKSTTI